ncbi:MAG: 4'-phosphopantetheinyl transferase family protein [Christensenellales bacterium]|jgi:phosphopantetheine--protein transferase-like protein
MRVYIDKIKATQDFVKQCIELYGIADAKLSINGNGKPCLDRGYHISVSHSGGLIAAAIGNDALGIDIERIKERDHSALAKRYFTANEYALVKSGGITRFYRLWTMKEAYMKIQGARLNTRVTEEKIIGEGYKIFHKIIDGYYLTVVSKDEEIIFAR